MDREPGSQRTNGPDEPSRGASFASAGAYAGLGFQFVLAILLFLYAGQWVDGKLGTKPLFIILGTFAGATAGFYAIYKKLMADQKREDELRKK
jgi:F0F1-type ATP synthase assembly protein I